MHNLNDFPNFVFAAANDLLSHVSLLLGIITFPYFSNHQSIVYHIFGTIIDVSPINAETTT